jgi:hypothetical protein
MRHSGETFLAAKDDAAARQLFGLLEVGSADGRAGFARAS